MHGVCTSCPGAEILDLFLHSKLDGVIIKYEEWAMADKRLS
jgi:hypothetical protein